MSSSPAWLSVALTTLAGVKESPERVLRTGIRRLPQSHILHHLNRWTRHVWRPAITSAQLQTLVTYPRLESVNKLGAGGASLLAALLDAVQRCNARTWLSVIGVMFLSNDPWAIDVGEDAKVQLDICSVAIEQLFLDRKQVSEAACKLNSEANELPVEEMTHTDSGDSFAELRCRVAALQLQLDDVTQVARRNEKNTKDLLSSFHFWSLLLLDEIRSYKNAAKGSSPLNATPTQTDTAFDMPAGVPPMRLINTVDPRFLHGVDTGGNSSGETTLTGAPAASGSTSPRVAKTEGRLKRVFRDGKWVLL